MNNACPKQYLEVLGKPLLQHTLEKLLALPVFARVVLAADADDPQLQKIIASLPAAQQKLIHIVAGGEVRAASVNNALQALADDAQSTDWILVHDAVRPCVHLTDIQMLIQQLQDEPAGGLLAVPVRDTVKRIAEGPYVVETLDRTTLFNASTPQMFRYALLSQALSQCLDQGLQCTDEAAAMEAMGFAVKLVPGHADNIKITYPEDLILAAALLAGQANTTQQES